MVNTKIIRNKIVNIQNTQKITRTMEMIAISKMKKMKEKLSTSALYLQNIMKIIAHFFQGKLKYHNYLFNRKFQKKKINIIIISSNRGLCGNLNHNVFKKAIDLIHDYKKKNIKCNLYILGMKGTLFFNSNCYNNIKEMINFDDDNITYKVLSPLTKKIITEYQLGNFDELFIIGNQLHGINKYIPYVIQLLPLQPKNFQDSEYTKYTNWDYLYEPDSTIVLDHVIHQYILFQVFQLVVENMVCEQLSRMFIMKTATDNSENIIQELKLLYNKIRQYSITQEIIEIISGVSNY